jgi:hypothetical protein
VLKIDLKLLFGLLIESFKYTHELKDKIAENDCLSSKFIFEFMNRIYKKYFNDDTVLNIQNVDDNGKRSPGEWLYDACIVRRKTIYDEPYKTNTEINIEILLAFESEFSTCLKDFAKDFGKLLCSKSDNKIYICGLNQITKNGRSSYIERKIRTINKYLKNNIDNMILIFFPSTKGNLWRKHKFDELKFWIEIYYKESSDKELTKFNI